MDHLHTYLGGNNRLWDRFDYTERYSIDVTEIFHTSDTNTHKSVISTSHRVVPQHDIAAWLGSACQSSRDRACLARVVWISVNKQDRCYDISADNFAKVVQSFGHQKAQQSFAGSYAGIANLHDAASSICLAYLDSHPKLALTWSWNTTSKQTDVICIAYPTKLAEVKHLLDQNFMQYLAGHAMLPPLAAAIFWSMKIDQYLVTIKKQLRGIEARTGHHDWKSRDEDPAHGDLFTLTAGMSGCRLRIASCTRNRETLTKWIDFISSHLDSIGPRHVPDSDKDERIRQHVDTLQHRAAMQCIDLEFIQQRVQTQLDTLYHLIAENDALIGHEIAKDSRLLAMSSQRDASSMKSLAVVTMFFLPGTFMAALFSMPLFEWADSGATFALPAAGWKPKLNFYLVFTVPLTLFTFSIWLLWMWYATLEDKRRSKIVKRQLQSATQHSEAEQLAMKKKAL